MMGMNQLTNPLSRRAALRSKALLGATSLLLSPPAAGAAVPAPAALPPKARPATAACWCGPATTTTRPKPAP